MYKSYFYLNRFAIELASLLNGKRIISCFSQDKEKLIIQFESVEFCLEVSVNHNEPFINVRNRFARARKNTIDFFESLLNSNVENVLIASDDRIFKFKTNKGDLFFAIRGKHTNLYSIENNTISSFKSEDDEILNRTLTEFNSKHFIDHFNQIDFTEIKNKSLVEIRNIYKFIGRDIENEVNVRKTLQQSSSIASEISKTDVEILSEVISIVGIGKPIVYINQNLNEINIAFNSFLSFKDYEKVIFEELTAAFNYFLIKKYQLQEKNSLLKRINTHLERELKRLSDRLNNLLAVVTIGSREAEYNKIANLLLINLNNTNYEKKEIELVDIYDVENQDKIIKIILDEKISIQKNAEKYFEKARDSKKNYEKSQKLFEESKRKFEHLKSMKEEISENTNSERLISIMKELNIKDQQQIKSESDTAIKFKHYLIENKYHIYVGKDSQNNDLLTTKFAKQNDFWFHARSVSGSHVVLRVENTKEVIPKNILKKAASLAAYHSKAKTAGIVPVSYTLKKYVIKKKGSPAGQVNLIKEDVLLVKPEIPIDVEYLTE